MKKAILVLAFLTACASNTPPRYLPDNESQFDSWRQCRIAYQQEHNPGCNPCHGISLLPEIDNMQDNAKLEGPAMSRAIDACMILKGYRRG